MKLIAIAVLVAGLALPAVAQTTGPYSQPGPFEVKNDQQGPGCHVFRPADLGAKPHAVILWGNGTRSMVPAYAPMLKHWASYGFVVAAAITNSAGSGKPLLDCLDYLTAENARDGSPLKGALDLKHVGASGHSQGGGGSIMAARDARITATAPIEAYTLGLGYEKGAEGQQHGPMLLLSGAADVTAVPERNQAPVFADANVPVVWATLKGAGHSVPANGDSGPFRPATTAWFLYQLTGDARAAAMFRGADCSYCADPDWVIQKKGVE
jgi:pimeloyl-ACP methyl ester carboxylesterase